MSQKSKPRIPIWQQPSSKRKTRRPILMALVALVIVATIIYLVLGKTPVPKVLVYLGPVVAMIGALVGFGYRVHAQQKKGEHTSLIPDILTTLFVVVGSVVIIAKTYSDEQTTQRQNFDTKTAQSRAQKHLDQISEDQHKRGEELVQQADRNKREEESITARFHHEQQFQQKVTQALAKANNTLTQVEAARLKNLAVANHVDEVSKTLSGFQKTGKGFKETAASIERTLRPIQDVKVAYRVILPLDRPEMQDYRISLEREVEAYLTMRKKIGSSNGFQKIVSDTFIQEVDITIKNREGAIDAKKILLDIRPGSTLYPTDIGAMGEALTYMTYEPTLYFYKSTSAKMRKKQGHGLILATADLVVSCNVPVNKPTLEYSVKSKTLSMLYNRFVITSTTKVTNRLVSVPDLANATVQVVRPNLSGSVDPVLNKRLLAIEKNTRLYDIKIEASGTPAGFGPVGIQHDFDQTLGDVATFNFGSLNRTMISDGTTIRTETLMVFPTK